MADALVSQGHTEHQVVQGNAQGVTTVATPVHLLVHTPAQAATQQQTLDS